MIIKKDIGVQFIAFYISSTQKVGIPCSAVSCGMAITCLPREDDEPVKARSRKSYNFSERALIGFVVIFAKKKVHRHGLAMHLYGYVSDYD